MDWQRLAAVPGPVRLDFMLSAGRSALKCCPAARRYAGFAGCTARRALADKGLSSAANHACLDCVPIRYGIWYRQGWRAQAKERR